MASSVAPFKLSWRKLDKRWAIDILYYISDTLMSVCDRFLHVDPVRRNAPIWRQIEEGMRRLVASGRVESGDAVPSVRELARALRINPATVSKAYRRLTETGLLTVRRGEGTFVSQLGNDEIVEHRRLLLDDGAAAYIRVASSVGASREEAARAVRDGWETARGNGGEGVTDGG